MLYGESGFSLSSPLKFQREGGEAEGGGDRPWRCPTPKTRQSPTLLGLLLGPGQGESKCVAVDLFSIFLSRLPLSYDGVITDLILQIIELCHQEVREHSKMSILSKHCKVK